MAFTRGDQRILWNGISFPRESQPRGRSQQIFLAAITGPAPIAVRAGV